MKNKPIIGITMGDPNGIGPEIIIKALLSSEVKDICHPVVIGDLKIMRDMAGRLETPLDFKGIKNLRDLSHTPVMVYNIENYDTALFEFGTAKAEAGRAVVDYIKTAVELAIGKKIDAIVTAPINKETLKMAGYSYPGHTKLLAELTGATDFGMMLVGGNLRVVLVTIHVPLRDVPSLIKKEDVLRKIRLAHSSRRYFGIERPRVAVCGLNPHSGEGGIFGEEDRKEILPAVALAKEEGIDASGPLPSDTLFYKAYRGDYDVVVAMYHDQGLIPLKMLAFGKAVNITLGLPIIRTSVGHGTAYDIAGKGMANPSSLIEAIKLAVQISLIR